MTSAIDVDVPFPPFCLVMFYVESEWFGFI
jgi:hypothetical protein